jgi:hypothetical protein
MTTLQKILRRTDSHAVRGAGTVLEISPPRVIWLGDLHTDRQRISSDWRKVGGDLGTVIVLGKAQRGGKG